GGGGGGGVNRAAEVAPAPAAAATAGAPAPARALALAGSLKALEATTKPTVSASSKVAPKIAARQSRSDPSRSTGTSCRPQRALVDPGCLDQPPAAHSCQQFVVARISFFSRTSFAANRGDLSQKGDAKSRSATTLQCRRSGRGRPGISAPTSPPTAGSPVPPPSPRRCPCPRALPRPRGTPGRWPRRADSRRRAAALPRAIRIWGRRHRAP